MRIIKFFMGIIGMILSQLAMVINKRYISLPCCFIGGALIGLSTQ